jgi:hypothetical protein
MCDSCGVRKLGIEFVLLVESEGRGPRPSKI